MDKVLTLPLTDESMLRIVRNIVKNNVQIFITKHAKERMRQRGIGERQVYACLMRGIVFEHAHKDIRGNWRMTLVHRYMGETVHVAVALKKIKDDDWVVVVTAF